MKNYPNERLPCHAPRPPQLQFATMPESQARSPSVYHARNSPQPQVEEAEFSLYGPRRYETGEQSPLVDSYDNVDRGSRPYTPRIDNGQGYMPWQSPFGQYDYLGLPQDNNGLQIGEDSRSVNTAFLQQGHHHMGPTSALDLGDNGHHIFSWESSTTLPPGFEPRHVNHVRLNLQTAFRTGRRSSLGRHLHLDTSSPGPIQTPLVPRSFANHANTSDRQVNPLEPATADGMDPSLDLPFDDGMLDWPHENGRIDLAGIRRRISMDSGLPDNATSRAHNRHIGPSVSEPRRHSQSSYQRVAQHHRAPAFQPLAFRPQDQGARRGIRGSLSPAQTVIPYGIPSLDNDEFAQNTQELVEGIQADNSPTGNPETYLSPTWQPAHRASSETHGDKRSDVSEDEVRQWPHIAPEDQLRVPTKGYKREYSSDTPSPTTPQARNKRAKRKFTADEKAEIARKRITGACNECRRAKRKVYESSHPSLYQCQQAEYRQCTHESPGIDSSPGAQSFSGISSTRSTPSRPEE